MEIIEMFVDELQEDSGVEAVSLVESPAIELDFVALKKQSQKPIQLAEVDSKKRILMGAALVPNKLIYRNQQGKEFHIFFNMETVRKASELFLKKGYQNNTTEEHELQLQGNTVVESWIKEDEVHDKSVKYGLSAPVGTWMISLKVENDETYKKAKNGTLKGFSIEGYFADKASLSVQKSEEEQTIDKIRQLLSNYSQNVTKTE